MPGKVENKNIYLNINHAIPMAYEKRLQKFREGVADGTAFLDSSDYNNNRELSGKKVRESGKKVVRRIKRNGGMIASNTSSTQAENQYLTEGSFNGIGIFELGGFVGLPNQKEALRYYPISQTEMIATADALTANKDSIFCLAFSPRYVKGKESGSVVYVNPQITNEGIVEQTAKKHFSVGEPFDKSNVTQDLEVFLDMLLSQEYKGRICMLQIRFNEKKDPNQVFKGLHVQTDTTGRTFITPEGVDKKTTFLHTLDDIYQIPPSEQIVVGGDSGRGESGQELGTDIPLFTIPGVRHLAVSDLSLAHEAEGIKGTTTYASTIEEGWAVLNGIIQTQNKDLSVAKKK